MPHCWAIPVLFLMFSPFIHLPLKRALMSTVRLLTPMAFPVQTRYPFLDNLLLLGQGMLQKVKRWVLFIGISGAVLALDRLLISTVRA